jgi:hypothetical protein
MTVPVERFHGVEDLPAPPRAEDALAGLAAACEASSLSRAFGHTRRAPRGVRRFRSVEDADAHRRRWEAGEDPDIPAPDATRRRR